MELLTMTWSFFRLVELHSSATQTKQIDTELVKLIPDSNDNTKTQSFK